MDRRRRAIESKQRHLKYSILLYTPQGDQQDQQASCLQNIKRKAQCLLRESCVYFEQHPVQITGESNCDNFPRHSRSSTLFATVASLSPSSFLYPYLFLPSVPFNPFPIKVAHLPKMLRERERERRAPSSLPSPVFAEPSFGQSGEIFHSVPRWMDGFWVGRASRLSLSRLCLR